MTTQNNAQTTPAAANTASKGNVAADQQAQRTEQGKVEPKPEIAPASKI